MSNRWQLPEIAESEITPLVSQLLDIIKDQQREFQKLKDEIAKLKGLKGRPDVKPSGLDKKTRKKTSADGKRPGSAPGETIEDGRTCHSQ